MFCFRARTLCLARHALVATMNLGSPAVLNSGCPPPCSLASICHVRAAGYDVRPPRVLNHINGNVIDEQYEEACQRAHDGTIAAIVTSMGGQLGAVAIIRISGPSAVAITSRIFRPGRKSTNGKSSVWKPKSHFVQYGTLLDLTGELVDEVC